MHPDWVKRHRLDIPSVVIAFLPFGPFAKGASSRDQAKQDAQLVEEINHIK